MGNLYHYLFLVSNKELKNYIGNLHADQTFLTTAEAKGKGLNPVKLV